jgi:hypothetical protein
MPMSWPGSEELMAAYADIPKIATFERTFLLHMVLALDRSCSRGCRRAECRN